MANGDVTTGELYRRLEDMDAKLTTRLDREFGALHTRMDGISTRTAANETDLAVMKDRMNRPALAGGITGGLAGLAWFVIEWLKNKASGQ